MSRHVVLFIEGDETGGVYECPAIEHEGRWWFAPKELEPPTGLQTGRLLLVRPSSGIAWESPDSRRTTLPRAVPKAVLDGAPSAGWEVAWLEVQVRLSPANPNVH